jgi:hypothetical protein
VAAVGNEVDLHNTHWHGNTVLWENHNADQCAPTLYPVVTLNDVCTHKHEQTWEFNTTFSRGALVGLLLAATREVRETGRAVLSMSQSKTAQRLCPIPKCCCAG